MFLVYYFFMEFDVASLLLDGLDCGVQVILPVTSFLLRQWQFGLWVTICGSFDRFIVGIGGFFYIWGKGYTILVCFAIVVDCFLFFDGLSISCIYYSALLIISSIFFSNSALTFYYLIYSFCFIYSLSSRFRMTGLVSQILLILLYKSSTSPIS